MRVYDVATETSRLIEEDDGISDPVWISDTDVVFLASKDNGTTVLHVRDGRPNGDQ